MFTIREVCEKFGCSRDTVARLIRNGELTAIKHGDRSGNGMVRITEESVWTCFAALKVTGTRPTPGRKVAS